MIHERYVILQSVIEQNVTNGLKFDRKIGHSQPEDWLSVLEHLAKMDERTSGYHYYGGPAQETIYAIRWARIRMSEIGIRPYFRSSLDAREAMTSVVEHMRKADEEEERRNEIQRKVDSALHSFNPSKYPEPRGEIVDTSL